MHPVVDCSPEQVDFALINPNSAYILKDYPKLKGVFSLFSGIDKILKYKNIIPKDVPIIRLISQDLARGMSEYIIYHVLRYYRQFDRYADEQKKQQWVSEYVDLNKRNIGILGLGELGRDAARKLSLLGLNVSAWSRNPKQLEGVQTYSGAQELSEFLRQVHILVSLLPLTPETQGLLNKAFLHQLPKGAFLINVARGQQVVERDLIALLEQEHLAGATLDVFETEPLPIDHAFWKHPKITITPHIASITHPCRESAKWFIDNMKLLNKGKKPLGGVVDLDKGY